MSDQSQSTDAVAAPSGTLEVQHLEAPPPTRAERLRALEAEFQATSTRSLHPRTQEVLVGLELESGDRIVGRGATTEAALADLERRMADFRAPASGQEG